MTLTNSKIYAYANSLLREVVAPCADMKLPVKINFYLQKNMQTLRALASEIEENRLALIHSHGTQSEDGETYAIPADKIEIVQKELNDLLSLEQEVQIYKINIDTLSDDLALTMGQMEALMFMIEE